MADAWADELVGG